MTLPTVQDAVDLGLAAPQQEVKSFGEVECLVVMVNVTPAGEQTSDDDFLPSVCQRTGRRTHGAGLFDLRHHGEHRGEPHERGVRRGQAADLRRRAADCDPPPGTVPHSRTKLDQTLVSGRRGPGYPGRHRIRPWQRGPHRMEIAATVRPARPDDAEAFAACHYACWQEAYSELWDEERFNEVEPSSSLPSRRRQIEEGRLSALARRGRRPGRRVSRWPVRPGTTTRPTETELYAIYVREAYYGTGVATDCWTPRPTAACVPVGLPGQSAGQRVLRQPRLHPGRRGAASTGPAFSSCGSPAAEPNSVDDGQGLGMTPPRTEARPAVQRGGCGTDSLVRRRRPGWAVPGSRIWPRCGRTARHISPRWIFVWVDDRLLVHTGPEEQKARNLAADPQCTLMVGTGSADDGLDVVLEADAVVLRDDADLRRFADALETQIRHRLALRRGGRRTAGRRRPPADRGRVGPEAWLRFPQGRILQTPAGRSPSSRSR